MQRVPQAASGRTILSCRSFNEGGWPLAPPVSLLRLTTADRVSRKEGRTRNP